MAALMPIKALLLDVGGVLLTDAWGHEARARAAEKFGLDPGELEDGHRLTFETFEMGRLTLKKYLDLVVFNRKRAFTHEDFWKFMSTQSESFPRMLEMVRDIKVRYELKIAIVSNEARELNAHRIQEFGLNEFTDFFVSSCFVHIRKPDIDMFRMALDMAQIPANQTVYSDDRLMFVHVAESLGIRGVHHTDYASTRAKLAAFGLTFPAAETRTREAS
jgi:putative hydrolase of the HAD superfamily